MTASFLRHLMSQSVRSREQSGEGPSTLVVEYKDGTRILFGLAVESDQIPRTIGALAVNWGDAIRAEFATEVWWNDAAAGIPGKRPSEDPFAGEALLVEYVDRFGEGVAVLPFRTSDDGSIQWDWDRYFEDGKAEGPTIEALRSVLNAR